MKKNLFVALVTILVAVPSFAQSWYYGAEVEMKSSYIWRGMKLTNQYNANDNPRFFAPYAEVEAYVGREFNDIFSIELSSYGGCETAANPYNEYGICLFANIQRFSIGINNYDFASSIRGTDAFEIEASYCIHEKFPLTIKWATIFAGSSDREEGALVNNFSSYGEISCPFTIGQFDINPIVTVIPYNSAYYGNDKGFAWGAALITAKYNGITFGDGFSVPITATAGYDSISEHPYFSLSVSINLDR